MKNKSFLTWNIGVSILLCSFYVSGQAIPDYFGQVPPGKTPVLFAPGIVSKPDRFEARFVYSPDCQEFFYAFVNNSGNMNLMTSRYVDEAWEEHAIANFSGPSWDFEPCYSPDGNRLYFTSKRNYGYFKLWYVNREGEGWSEPICMPEPVNTFPTEELFSMPLNDNEFYFVSSRSGGYGGKDLYHTSYQYHPDLFIVTGEPFNLGPLINTASNEFDPCPGPNNEYIIFMRNGDLFISFMSESTRFTNPKSLGSSINTSSTEVGPAITPDHLYLMFTRFSSGNDGDIYWVSLSIIDSLRESNFQPYLSNPFHDTVLTYNQAFEFQIPDNTFHDDDGNNILTYSATLSDNSPLPGWLAFNPATLIFSGIAETEGTFSIKLTATDDQGSVASMYFIITVEHPVQLADIATERTVIYPNPSDDMIIISFGDIDPSEAEIDIIEGISGRTLKTVRDYGGEGIDVGSLKPGLYLVRIHDRKKILHNKMVIQ